MKKIIYSLILVLVVLSLLVFANREIKSETVKKPILKPLSAAEKLAARKNWEASPDGIMFKNWEESPVGKKVYESATKISKSVKDYTNMEGVITSLSLPPGSRLGFGMMIKIKDVDYILSFWALKSNEFQQLRSIKVNDKIIIKSHFVSKAPKYDYPIITGEYVERNSKIIYKRAPRKGGC